MQFHIKVVSPCFLYGGGHVALLRGHEHTRGVWLVRLANFTDKETEA